MQYFENAENYILGTEIIFAGIKKKVELTSLTTYLKKRANNFCPLLYLISRNLAHDFYIICLIFILFSYTKVGLFFWLSNKETACNVEDTRNEGSVSELGRFPAVGHDNQLQYSC